MDQGEGTEELIELDWDEEDLPTRRRSYSALELELSKYVDEGARDACNATKEAVPAGRDAVRKMGGPRR